MEIKFLTHLTKNFYLYFFSYFIFKLLFNHQIDLSTFILGMFAYSLGYAPVYFLNDSQDWEEDKREGRSNLYTTISNPVLFWLIAVTLVFIGAMLGLVVSKIGYLLLILSYIPNIFHSLKPFRLRKRVILGSINYFALNLVKFILIVYYLRLPVSEKILPLVFLFASLATVGGLVYKRYKQKNHLAEVIFGIIASLSTIYSVFVYPMLLIFILPVFLMFVYIVLKFKNSQAPTNLLLAIFVVYTILVFAYTSLR